MKKMLLSIAPYWVLRYDEGDERTAGLYLMQAVDLGVIDAAIATVLMREIARRCLPPAVFNEMDAICNDIDRRYREGEMR